MCGHITRTFDIRDIQVRWSVDHDLPLCGPRFNIAPEQISPAIEKKVPVIIRDERGNRCRLMQWGLVPYWAKDTAIGGRMINARAETLTEKPTFKHLVGSRRCIIPADRFYEWRKEGGRKVPMWIHLKSREPFGLASLWDAWRTPDGRASRVIHDYHEPNELLRPIHNRMPVILRPEQEGQWLDASRTPFAKARLLKPYPAELMDAHQVSTVVNLVRYEGPECFRPVPADLSGSQLSFA